MSTGLLCLRHILVETEQEANVIVDELRDGADFAELAAERSLEGSASITGGALTGTESQCLPTAQYISGFDADFVAAAFALRQPPGHNLLKHSSGGMSSSIDHGQRSEAMSSPLTRAPTDHCSTLMQC